MNRCIGFCVWWYELASWLIEWCVLFMRASACRHVEMIKEVVCVSFRSVSLSNQGVLSDGFSLLGWVVGSGERDGNL